MVAAAIAATGAMSWLVDTLLFGRKGGMARLSTATAAMSSFVPNTPLVALAAPRVVRWARGHGVSSSRLLMPLSFASILGGLGIFEVTPVGLPVAIVGVIVMIGVVPRLLRERTSAGDSMRATARTFQIQMVVEPAGPLVDITIEQAQLRDLDGLFLAAIERDGRVIAARPDIARAAVLSRVSGASASYTSGRT